MNYQQFIQTILRNYISHSSYDIFAYDTMIEFLQRCEIEKIKPPTEWDVSVGYDGAGFWWSGKNNREIYIVLSVGAFAYHITNEDGMMSYIITPEMEAIFNVNTMVDNLREELPKLEF